MKNASCITALYDCELVFGQHLPCLVGFRLAHFFTALFTSPEINSIEQTFTVHDLSKTIDDVLKKKNKATTVMK